MNVKIVPLPAAFRGKPKRVWPLPPPIFPGGAPTPEDRQLARALFEQLDADSQTWYGHSPLFDGCERKEKS
jgi:hypothetical protein